MALKKKLAERNAFRPVDTTLTPDSPFPALVDYWLADLDLEFISAGAKRRVAAEMPIYRRCASTEAMSTTQLHARPESPHYSMTARDDRKRPATTSDDIGPIGVSRCDPLTRRIAEPLRGSGLFKRVVRESEVRKGRA